MVEVTLLATALAASVAAGTFLAAGLNLRRRVESPHAREALALFSLWWIALSVYAVAGATLDLSAALGVEAAGPAVALHYAQAVALCIGLWGLMYYVAFILTGRRGFLPLLAVFYALYYGAILFWLTLGKPIALAADQWRARLAYESPLVGGATGTLLLVLPPLVASATYLLVLLQAKELTRRYRIVLVSGSTLAWFGAVLLRGDATTAALGPLLALASAFAITWAYQPPRWVSRRLEALGAGD